MSELLTSAESRLLDLLRAGAVSEDALSPVLEDFLARREAGEELDLGPFLVGQGLVSVSTVQELLGGGDAPAHAARVGVELPALPDAPPRGRVSARSAKRSSGTHKRSSRPRNVLPGRDTGKRRRSARSEPLAFDEESDDDFRTAKFDPKELAAASKGESERLVPIAADERTRSFDPEALAASSRARGAGRRGILLPVLVIAALAVVALGAIALRESDTIEPLPPPETETPVASAPPARSPSPTPSASPDVEAQFLALAQRAGQLEARDDYAGALALLRGAPVELRARRPDAFAQAEGRLEGLRRFSAAADVARAALDALEAGTPNVAQRREREAAVAQAEALIEGASRDEGRTSAARRLMQSLRIVQEATPEAKVPGHGARGEPKERTAAFAKGAKEGATIVAAMRAGITQARQKAAERERAASARVRERSRKEPITVSVGGVQFEKAVVSRYDAQGFALRATDKEVSYDWSRIVKSDPKLAQRIRRLAVDPDDARDQLDFGRWCLVHRLWDEAKDAFRRAVLLDAKLKVNIPDVGRIARASQVFRGKLSRVGNGLELSYSFHLPAHNADWTLAGGARGGVDAEQRVFVVKGRGLSLASLREVGWERELSIVAAMRVSQNARSLVGVTFRAGSPDEVSYLLGVDPRAQKALLLRRQEKKLSVLDRKAIVAVKRVEANLICAEDRFEVKIAGKNLFRVPLPADWGRTRVLIGGSLSDPQASAVFESLALTGQARRDWVRKAFGAFDDHLRAYLARTDELELFSEPDDRRPQRVLSCEDEWGMTGVTQDALAHDERGRAKLASGTPLDLLAASNAFQRAVELSPSFAAARYRRGLALERLGRADLALQEVKDAAAECPHFYEALAAQARILARDGQLQEALSVVEAALSERPDYPPALSAKALVHFRRGQLDETQRLLDLALALDPWDDEIRAFRRNVRNVRRGPPWERTYREETVNYRVLTDISQAKGRDYADQLEVIREFYTEVFGAEGDVRAQRATVLIFDTEEGFQAYADLTTDDRVESLLGYYLPRYDQLLLYEGRDDASGAETRRVLYHEAFHQFIYPLIPDLPYWVNEGLADYFSATRIEHGQVVSRGGSLPARLRDLRRYVSERGRPLSPSGLVRETPSEFYSGPVAVKYAQAWSMVHFFLHGKEGDYLARFQRYLQRLREGGSPTEAYEVAFKGMDWKAFERAWWAHVKTL